MKKTNLFWFTYQIINLHQTIHQIIKYLCFLFVFMRTPIRIVWVSKHLQPFLKLFLAKLKQRNFWKLSVWILNFLSDLEMNKFVKNCINWKVLSKSISFDKLQNLSLITKASLIYYPNKMEVYSIIANLEEGLLKG